MSRCDSTTGRNDSLAGGAPARRFRPAPRPRRHGPPLLARAAWRRGPLHAVAAWWRSTSSGIAALEFALMSPVLFAFLGGITDFGLVYYYQTCLTNAVAAGAQYAMLTDQSGGTLTSDNIRTVMQSVAQQSMGSSASVTPTAGDPTRCYCVSGTSPTLTINAGSPVACNSTCPSGGAAQKFVQLSLSYNYRAIFPFYSMLAHSTTLSQTAWVPLQ